MLLDPYYPVPVPGGLRDVLLHYPVLLIVGYALSWGKSHL